MTEERRELTALVVDDSSQYRDFLVEFLSLKFPNLKIETASDGEEAYSRIRDKKPDILYTDLSMPRMSGDQLLEKLVKEGVKIPTFVLSGDFQEDIDKGRLGAVAIYFSYRMYTDEQIAKLNLPIRLNITELKEQIKREYIRVLKEGESYDLGFTALTKPYKADDLIQRTRKVMEVVYGIRSETDGANSPSQS